MYLLLEQCGRDFFTAFFFIFPIGINVTDTFEAIKMLDKVTPEMKKLGEGALPYDGGLYPVRFEID
jgi:hypothetical protein